MRVNRGDLFLLSRFPYVLYIWVITTISILAFTTFFLGSPFKNIFTLILITAGSYYLFCRKSCTIQVYEDKFRIHYFLTKNIKEVKFIDIVKMDYKKGFYDFSAPVKNTYHFKLICYDTLFLELKTGNVQLDINTRIGGFNKIKEIIREKIREISE